MSKREPSTRTTSSSLQKNIFLCGNTKLYFRPLQISDRWDIQKLHKDWFPVEYTDDFYDSVVNNLSSSGEPIYSCAVSHFTDEENGDMSSDGDIYRAWNSLSKFLGLIHINIANIPTIDSEPENSFTNTNKPNTFCDKSEISRMSNLNESGGKKEIVGCIVGLFMNTSRCNETLVLSLIRDPLRHTKIFYIMTIGTILDFRNCGLATRLINKCIKLNEKLKAVVQYICTSLLVTLQQSTFTRNLGSTELKK